MDTIRRATTTVLQWLLYEAPFLALGLILLDEVVVTVSDFDRLISTDVRLAVLAAVLTSVVLTIRKEYSKIRETLSVSVFAGKRHAEFIPAGENTGVRDAYRNSREINILTLAGTQFAKLGSQQTLRDLFDLSRTGSVRILLGDPESEGVQLRYKPGFGEPKSYETGPPGIRRRLLSLHELKKDLPEHQANCVDIRVFSAYPTVSMISVDATLYASIYGYNMRGGDGPKIRTTLDSALGEFLMDHFENVYAASTPLEEWVQKQNEADQQ